MRAALILSLVLAVAGCGQSGADSKGHGPGGGMPPPEVSVVKVEPKSQPVAFEYVGQTAGSREAEVRARVQGILVSRNFREGESVRMRPRVMEKRTIGVIQADRHAFREIFADVE